jgi:hypothetical protein
VNDRELVDDFCGPAALSSMGILMVFTVALAVTARVADAVPESHATVVGNPKTRVESVENVHSEAFATSADTVTDPPVKTTVLGSGTKLEIVGLGGAGSTVIDVVADDSASDPRAVSLMLSLPGFGVELAATAMTAEALPPLHVTVVGRPVMLLAKVENVHSDAPVTSAESITEPPVYGSVDGLAA